MNGRVLLLVLLVVNTIVVASVTSGNVPDVIGDNAQTTVTGRLAINYPEGNYPAGYYLVDSVGLIELIPGAAGAGPLYQYDGDFIQVTGNLVNQDGQRILYMEKWEPLAVHAAGWEPQPVTGQQNIVIIVVDFPDAHLHPNHNNAYFQDMLTGAHGSMNEYFIEDSYGSISIGGIVVGPYMLEHYAVDYHVWTWESCANGGVNYYALANEAIQMADANGVNFNDYPHIIIVGRQIWGCRVRQFWPPVWTGEGFQNEAIFVNMDEGLSLYAHEFSHHLGLPDLYDKSCASSPPSPTCSPYNFIGGWDPMGPTFPWLSHHSAFSKMRLGWIPETEVANFDLDYTRNAPGGRQEVTFTIDAMANPTSGYHALRIGSDPWHKNQYFLVEARQKVGYDEYLPSSDTSPSPDHGVLITYVDRDKGTQEGIVRLEPPSPYFATDTCDQQPVTREEADGDAVWRVGETYVNNWSGFGIAIKSWIDTPSGHGFVVSVTAPYVLYAVNFDARTTWGAFLPPLVDPTVSYQINANSYFPTPISGTGTVLFTVWMANSRSITYTYQGTVSGTGVTYVFDHDDHGGTLHAPPPSVRGPHSTRCSFSAFEYPFSASGTGCPMQTITGYYSSSIPPPIVVALAAVGATSITTGVLATWILHLTITAATDLSDVRVQGGLDPTVTVASICVDGVCTQANEFKAEWPTMLAGTSHDVIVTVEASYDYPGVVSFIRDWSVQGSSQLEPFIIPVGGGPEVTVEVQAPAAPVGGQVYSPSAAVMLVPILPYLLLALLAVGAARVVVRKRYLSQT